MAHRDWYKCWLAKATSTIVVIGISQEPKQQAGKNKNRTKQQWFDG